MGSYSGIKHFRRFYINNSFGGCSGDMGWMVVIDNVVPWGCPKDNNRPWPTFFYDKHPTVGHYGYLTGK